MARNIRPESFPTQTRAARGLNWYHQFGISRSTLAGTRRESMSSILNSAESPLDIDTNGGEQMIWEDTSPPEIRDNSPKPTRGVFSQLRPYSSLKSFPVLDEEINPVMEDIVAPKNESPSHNDVGSLPQSPQRDSALPSPLSDASGHVR